jgi:hypothetical protein
MPDQGSVLSPPLLKLLISGAACGFVLHQFVKRVEVDRHPLSILGVVAAVLVFLAFGLQYVGVQYARYWTAYQVAVLVDIVCCCVSLHKYLGVSGVLPSPQELPGPFGAKLSNLWSLGKVVESKVRWYQVVGNLKNKYGDYVRTGNAFHIKQVKDKLMNYHKGPRELIIFDSEAINLILGFNSKSRKGPSYGAVAPHYSGP